MEVTGSALGVVAVGLAVEDNEGTTILGQPNQVWGEGALGHVDVTGQHRSPFSAVLQLDAELFIAEGIDGAGAQRA